MDKNTVNSDKIIVENKSIRDLSDEEFVKIKVDSLKPNSTAYKYYKFTPFNELKSREEKLIKREIEHREMIALDELDPNELRKAGLSPSGNTVEPVVDKPVTTNNESTADVSLFSQIMEFITKTIPDTFSSWFGEGSAIQSAYNSIVESLRGATNRLFGSDIDSESFKSGANITFGVTVSILALAAVWKLVKRYVNKDGTINKEASAQAIAAASESIDHLFATDENSSYFAMKVINEDTETDKNSMGGYVKSYSNKMLDDLLKDEQFIKYMEKNNVELLDSLKAYKNNSNKLIEESVENVITEDNNVTALNEKSLYDEATQSLAQTWQDAVNKYNEYLYGSKKETKVEVKPESNVDKPVAGNGGFVTPGSDHGVSDKSGPIDEFAPKSVGFFSSIWSSVSNGFLALGDYVKDGVEWVGKKVGIIDNKLQKEASNLEKGAYAAGAISLAIIGLASLWYYYKKQRNNDKATVNEDVNYLFLEKIDMALNILSEVKSQVKEDCKFPEIEGRGKKLVDNLVQRAKIISVNLVNDKDFISFAQKHNPETLKCMKKIAKKANKE